MSERAVKKIGRVTFYGGRQRKKSDHMGRFGGGWNYKLGITAGSWYPKSGMTILVALITDEYRVQIAPRAK